MALKVWIGENYEHRHEQEQIKEFLSLMHREFDNQPGQVHLLCNFICGGSQIDAAILKKDAFVPIEFKTASGPVSGAENGKWRVEDPQSGRLMTLGGGSHAVNPFNQIGNARTAIANKLETEERTFLRPHEEERVADWRHFVHGLVVLAPNLNEGVQDEIGVDFYAKPWFGCCRMNRAAECLLRTTTRDGELTGKNLLNIVKKVLKLEEAEIKDGIPVLLAEDDQEPAVEATAAESDSTEEDLEAGDDACGETLASLFDMVVGSQESKAEVPSEAEVAVPVREDAGRTPVVDSSTVQETLGVLNDFGCEDLSQSASGSAKVNAHDQKGNLPVKVEGEWPEVSPIEVKYISNGVREAVKAKNLKGTVTEIFRGDSPDFAVPGNWGALCVFEYEGVEKSAEEVKDGIDYFLDEDLNPSYLFGNRIIWPFPSDSLSHLDDGKERKELPVERRPVEPMDDLHTLEAPVRELAHQTALPRVLDVCIYRTLGAPFSVDSRSGDAGERSQRLDGLEALGRYFPVSYCETYGVFDIVFDRLWTPFLSRKKELLIQVVDGGYGGSFWGWMWALRRYIATNQLTQVKVFVKEDDSVAWSQFVEVVNIFKESNEFSFTLDVVAGDPQEKVDFCLLNGRRDGTGGNPVSVELLDSALRDLAMNGVLFVSDIADLYQAQTVSGTVDKVLEAKNGALVDLTERLNGGTAGNPGDGCLQTFGCQVVSLGCLTQRRIAYRLLGCGKSAQLFK